MRRFDCCAVYLQWLGCTQCCAEESNLRSSSDFLPGATPTQKAMILKIWIAHCTFYSEHSAHCAVHSVHWHYMYEVSLKAEVHNLCQECQVACEVATWKLALRWMNKKQLPFSFWPVPVDCCTLSLSCLAGQITVDHQETQITKQRDHLIWRQTNHSPLQCRIITYLKTGQQCHLLPLFWGMW